MKKKGNKHLGMSQDELAESFAVKTHKSVRIIKSGKSVKPPVNGDEKEDDLGLTEMEVKVWNKKLKNISSKKKVLVAH